MQRFTHIIYIVLASLLVFAPAVTMAAPFSEIRIGDIDGFGFGNGASSCPSGQCRAANGGNANTGVGGVLGAESLPIVGDYLPDLNQNGVTRWNDFNSAGRGDEFDNRSGEGVSGTGFTDTGTTGAEYTDLSLSQSYDQASSQGSVWNANTGSWGSGGAFPAGASSTLPNQPGFEFRFQVAKTDISSLQSIFFNVVFGDFDVTPFDLELTYGDGSVETLSITPQNNTAGEDGLIQASFAELAFGDVFSDGGSVWNGFLDVTFDAPFEPYTAYDFVELSTVPISTNVPEPGSLALLFLGLMALVPTTRRMRRAG